MRSLVTFAAVALGAAGIASCGGNRARIEVEDARAGWVDFASNRRVYVELDLLGDDQLGGNIGRYCLTTTFAGTLQVPDACANDLADGDRKTMRVESQGDQAESVPIHIVVSLIGAGPADFVGRDLIGPVAPK